MGEEELDMLMPRRKHPEEEDFERAKIIKLSNHLQPYAQTSFFVHWRGEGRLND
jgi:hypothetical protein